MSNEQTLVPHGLHAVRVHIEGRVQGVGFRAFVDREARARGLNGFVRNRRDGRVEAVFSGDATVVDDMIALCRRGPRGSRVGFVKVLEENDVVASGFHVAATA